MITVTFTFKSRPYETHKAILNTDYDDINFHNTNTIIYGSIIMIGDKFFYDTIAGIEEVTVKKISF